jgi:hypothetical protein
LKWGLRISFTDPVVTGLQSRNRTIADGVKVVGQSDGINGDNGGNRDNRDNGGQRTVPACTPEKFSGAVTFPRTSHACRRTRIDRS